MTKKILLAVGLGIGVGMFMPDAVASMNDHVMTFGLCALLFFVGIDLGKSDDLTEKIRKIGLKVFIIPISIGLGSIVGGILLGLLLGYRWNEGAAVAAGFSWYSLAPILIAPYSSELSAIAFLSNVTREVAAVISIPFIAKYIGHFEAIAPTGAAGMDTLLPIVSKETDSTTALVCFVSGVVLSFAVPVLVSFFISF